MIFCVRVLIEFNTTSYHIQLQYLHGVWLVILQKFDYICMTNYFVKLWYILCTNLVLLLFINSLLLGALIFDFQTCFSFQNMCCKY